MSAVKNDSPIIYNDNPMIRNSKTSKTNKKNSKTNKTMRNRLELFADKIIKKITIKNRIAPDTSKMPEKIFSQSRKKVPSLQGRYSQQPNFDLYASYKPKSIDKSSPVVNEYQQHIKDKDIQQINKLIRQFSTVGITVNITLNEKNPDSIKEIAKKLQPIYSDIALKDVALKKMGIKNFFKDIDILKTTPDYFRTLADSITSMKKIRTIADMYNIGIIFDLVVSRSSSSLPTINSEALDNIQNMLDRIIKIDEALNIKNYLQRIPADEKYVIFVKRQEGPEVDTSIDLEQFGKIIQFVDKLKAAKIQYNFKNLFKSKSDPYIVFDKLVMMEKIDILNKQGEHLNIMKLKLDATEKQVEYMTTQTIPQKQEQFDEEKQKNDKLRIKIQQYEKELQQYDISKRIPEKQQTYTLNKLLDDNIRLTQLIDEVEHQKLADIQQASIKKELQKLSKKTSK